MNSCPVCHSTSIKNLLQLPACPIHTNVLLKSKEEACQVPRADIHLGFCDNCSHTFNTTFNPCLLSYAEGYENSLYFSPTFRRYASDLIDYLIETFDLHDKTIVEIGSGDGQFLTQLCEAGGNRGIGFDPSAAPVQSSQDVIFIQDLYTEKYTYLAADFVCCRHVLEHLHAPYEMLASVRATLGTNTSASLYFEVPNVEFLMKGGSLWDFIYPHYSYFSATSLQTLFAKAKFCPLRTRTAFSNQFLSIEAGLAEAFEPCTPVDSQDGTDVLSRAAAQLTETSYHTVEFWRRELHIRQMFGHKVVMWGGGAKCVTFINVVANEGQIEYVVDVNPRKYTLFLPGSGAQIVAPEFLAVYRPDLVIITNPIYEGEIRSCLINLGLECTQVKVLHTVLPVAAQAESSKIKTLP